MNNNPLEFMKNIQDMQSKMGDMKEKLNNITSTGSAGGGLVEITMNGQNVSKTGIFLAPFLLFDGLNIY